METLIKYLKTLKPEYAVAAFLLFHDKFAAQSFMKLLPREESAPDWMRAFWNCNPRYAYEGLYVAYDDLRATLKELEGQDGSDNPPAAA